MIQLTKNDYELLTKLVTLNQEQVKRLMSMYLKKHYPKVIEREKFILVEGTIPICLVAHLDTVFDNSICLNKSVFYDREQGVLWSPDGAGFDDRAGIFAIVKILQSGLRPHIILCCDEEVGGKGAAAVTKSYPFGLPFSCNYFIELDRAGYDDMVFYNCNNPEFTSYVKKFGFIEQFGSFTDISILCPHFKIAGVNLSIGYELEHSTSEFLYLKGLFRTVTKVKKMLQEKDIPSFEYIEGTRFSWNFSWGSFKNQGFPCDCCKNTDYSEEEMFPVLAIDGTTQMFCPDCISGKVSWCTSCGNPYEKINPNEPTTGVCDICREVKDNGTWKRSKESGSPKA